MTETTKLFSMILTDSWNEEITQAVGEVAVAFAQLEHVLWISPKRIRGLRFLDWEAVAGMIPIPQRCDQIADAYASRKMSQDREAKLERLLSKVKKVAKRRNAVIHARGGCKKSQGKLVSSHRVWKGVDYGVNRRDFIQLRDDIRILRDQLGRYSW